MKIEDVFEEVYTGFNINNSRSTNTVEDVYFIQKDSIAYTNIIKDKLIQRRVTSNIRKKYILEGRDIVISLKKPFKVGTCMYNYKDKKIIIPNNFIILRGINRDLYSYIFVANYLENIGIDKFISEHSDLKRDNKDLTVADIKSIELPKIDKDSQMKISKLMNNINERSAIYSTILKNDNEIIKYALNLVIGDKDVK